MESGMYKNILEQPQVLQRLVDSHIRSQAGYAKDIRARRRIYLVGTGASLNAAMASLPAFARFANTLPSVIPASEVSCYTHLFDKDAAVILISQSGESYETRMMCELMTARGLPFWGITNEPDSTLAKMATEALMMNAEKEVSSATKTYTATLMLLYIVAVFGNTAGQDALCRLPELTGETLNACRSRVKELAARYLNTNTLYALGDNLNGPTARAAALMFKEKDLIHAEGMTASEFRHGAVEVIQPGLDFYYTAPGFANAGETQKHVSYLSELECRLIMASPKPYAGIEPENWLQVSDCGEDTLSQLCAVLPAQLLSEEVARQKGLDVDGFRYLTKVVGEY